MPDSAVNTGEAQSNELLPPENDPNVGYRVFALLEEVLRAKQGLSLPQRWTRNHELGSNRHWRARSSKINLLSANLLFTHRTRTVNHLTDNNPTFNVARITMKPGQEDIYEKLLRTAEYWWNETEQQHELEESVINGETYGCTIEGVQFNPDLEYGMGEVETLVIDPFYFGFYPTKCRRLQSCLSVMYFRPISIFEARRKWPKLAAKIRPDDELLRELGDERQEAQAGTAGSQSAWGIFSGVVKSLANLFQGGGQGKADEVLVVECWVKDYTMIEVKGEKLPQSRYRGYLRRVMCCNGGALVLEDQDNPSINPALPREQAVNTYLWDKFPFSLTPSVTDTSNPWGASDFQQLEQIQEEIDKTISQVSLMKDKAVRLKIINPLTSGVQNEEFTNAPGIINPSNTVMAQAIRYLDPPPIPADLIEVLRLYKDFFFLIAGSFELEAAQTPGREVIAYKAIAALLERASTMLRGKIRNYSRMIRERGRMYLSHVMNWYEEERFISYEQDGEEMSMTVKGTEMIVPARLTVVSGSTMPRSQVQEREEAIDLFNKQAIDQTELLKKLDWPDRNKVLRRMEEGPLSIFFDYLREMGWPEELISLFSQVSQMEDKDLVAAIEGGSVPNFEALAAQISGMAEAEPELTELEQAEVRKIKAEVAKIEADARLAQEKINTEKVEQEVKRAGKGFDREELRIERAKTVSGMAQGEQQRQKDLKRQEEENPKQGRQGIRSDNKEV